MTALPRYRCAAVFFVNRRGELLLRLRDDRPDILEPNHWDIIGGLIEHGETPEEAVRREVSEELGIEPLGSAFWQEHAGRITDFYLFHASLDEPAEALALTEGQEVRYFAPAEAATLPLVPWLRDVLPVFAASAAYATYR